MRFFPALAAFISVCLTGIAGYAQVPSVLSVTAIGEVPGIKQAELPGFLADAMNADPKARFKFTPAVEPQVPPDRIEWRFKPNAYAFGVSRYLGPGRSTSENLFGVHRLCSVEGRLFRAGLYQKLVFGQLELNGGKADAGLMGFIRQQTTTLLDDAVGGPE